MIVRNRKVRVAHLELGRQTIKLMFSCFQLFAGLRIFNKK